MKNLDSLYDLMDRTVGGLFQIQQDMKDQRAAQDAEEIVTMLTTGNYEIDSIDQFSITIMVDLYHDEETAINILADVSILDMGSVFETHSDWGLRLVHNGYSFSVNQIVIEDLSGYQPYGYPITNTLLVDTIEQTLEKIYTEKGFI